MATIRTISPKTLEGWLKLGEVVLIDVREPVEYEAEFIEGSQNLPLSQLKLEQISILEDQKLVLHCQSGGRSMMACKQLKDEGFVFEAWNLEGGIVAWKEAELPVKSSNKKILLLDRQVQIVIGLIVLVGTLLGLWINSTWFALPIIIAIGLINAGLTGWCGLAKLLAKMPWNTKSTSK